MRRFPLKQVTSGTFSRATSKHTRSFSTGGKTIFGSRLLISACLVLTATSFALNNNKYNGITRPLTTTSLCEGAASSFEKDKFTETALFPPVQAYYKGMMKVSDIHTIAYSIYGNPNGKPILYVHGGPGGGTDPAMARFFDPAVYKIILVDQRGCGDSVPFANLVDNTTYDSVRDFEKLRVKLGVEKWQVFGGSWGSTLGLAYAIEHPDRVTELVLRGIFLVRKKELDWLYQSPGANYIYPEDWAKYEAAIPADERGDYMKAYGRRLRGELGDEEMHKAAKAWSMWEGRVSKLIQDPLEATTEKFGDDKFALAFARIENHYFTNEGFFPRDGFLLEKQNIDKIRHIPTVIVQGRYDVVCPAISAYDLKQVFPEAELIYTLTGHSGFEKEIIKELVGATEKFKNANRKQMVASMAGFDSLVMPKQTLIATSAKTKYDLSYYLKSALAGGICCSITHGALCPVDVVKTRIQLDPAKYNKGLVGGFGQVIKEEGMAGLATGLGPTVVGYFIQGWFKFGGVEFFKIQFSGALGDEKAWNNRNSIYLASSAMAEFIADIFLCPLEATRIRLVSNPSFASGLAGGAARLMKEDGILKGFYSGFGPILLKQIPYTMAKFAVQGAAAEKIAKDVVGKDLASLQGGTKLGVSLLSGVIAGVAAAIISHPADTLLSKVNKAGAGGEGSIATRLGRIASEIGPYKLMTVGLGARCVMIGTLTAGQFLLFDIVMDAVGAQKFHFHPPGEHH